MANPQHLEILTQGVTAWNKWRQENPEERPDLVGVDLSDSATLTDDGHLLDPQPERIRIGLSWGVNFNEADLTGADFSGTDLSGAHVNNANLSNAMLLLTRFRYTELSGARLEGATLGNTFFLYVDLSKAQGLVDVRHIDPSEITLSTISRSKGGIPEAFLRGCGLTDADIEFTKLANPELTNDEINQIAYRIVEYRATGPIQISPVFISYSSKDREFVDKIDASLKTEGIRFWRDVHDVVAGRLETQIDGAVRRNPTFLLVLSERSVESDWVEHEIRTARKLEKELKRDVICPIALDQSWKDSRWPRWLREQIMEYAILDFSKWREEESFGRQFKKLVDGLQIYYGDKKPSQ